MIKIRTEMLHFATVGHIFEGLSGAQIMHSISLFEAWEVRSPKLQTVFDLELKRRSYGRLKTIAQSTNGNFAAVKWAAKFPFCCRRALSLRSHTQSLLLHFLPP